MGWRWRAPSPDAVVSKLQAPMMRQQCDVDPLVPRAPMSMIHVGPDAVGPCQVRRRAPGAVDPCQALCCRSVSGGAKGLSMSTVRVGPNAVGPCKVERGPQTSIRHHHPCLVRRLRVVSTGAAGPPMSMIYVGPDARRSVSGSTLLVRFRWRGGAFDDVDPCRA